MMMLLLLGVLSATALMSNMDLSSRLAGGSPADYTPWIAMLSYGDVNSKFQCGASILTKRHLLTAAHCVNAAYVNGSLTRSYMATVGTNIRDGSGQNYSIIGNYTHPNYTMYQVKNDLGILLTNTSITFSLLVNQVTLNFNTVGDGVYVIIYGYGSSGVKNPLSTELEELEMLTVNSSYCLEETQRVAKEKLGFSPPFVYPEAEICAFKGFGKGTCKGDSGSPLVCADNYQQVGVTSWGIPCALGAPDIFSRLSSYKEWILSVLDEMGYKDELKYTMDNCSTIYDYLN
ncbi:chymotrypsin-2-like [Pieris rapae]|uniref:chymotrypsin-2-like n=1 Tax=Pieris rapae TaxID=64459 RepID=UPI001E2801AC|nr:chymotrypsin-2-like [Pieris rapae]